MELSQTEDHNYTDAFSFPAPADREWVLPLLTQGGGRAAECNFTTLYLWSLAIPQAYTRIGDRIVIRLGAGRRSAYLFPMGSGALEPALDFARNDAITHESPFFMVCLTEEEKKQLETEYPGRFRFEEDRDNSDYLYSIEKLCTVSGKKLHGKRNHINRFCERFPDWRFELLTQDSRVECLQLEADWIQAQEEQGEASDSTYREREEIYQALTHMDALQIDGGLIRADGQILAFTMGSLTSPDCYEIHFEKAYSDVQGAFTIINREMARWVHATYPEVLYMNREDDMGLEGLRKAKLSYYPEILLEKYTAFENESWEA